MTKDYDHMLDMLARHKDIHLCMKCCDFWFMNKSGKCFKCNTKVDKWFGRV